MGTSGIFGLSSQLSNSLTQMQETQQEELAVNTDVAATLVSTAQTDSVSISSEAYAKSQNMLETNFVDGNTADTTYVDAQLAAFSVKNSLQNSMNDSLKSSLESIVAEASFWYSASKDAECQAVEGFDRKQSEAFFRTPGQYRRTGCCGNGTQGCKRQSHRRPCSSFLHRKYRDRYGPSPRCEH